MLRKATILIFIALFFLPGGNVFAQEKAVPIVKATLVDSSVFNGIYRGIQNQIFCEPTTGNLVTAWYRYFKSDADNPRQVTAATSTDGGKTWTVHEQINNGVGAGMNGRYPAVSGTPSTPVVAYSDRNPTGTYQNSRPVVAVDILGWSGGLFDNRYVDNSDMADTVLYGRYVSVTVDPNNDQRWAVGTYHNADPAEGLYFYISTDGGNNWSRPVVVCEAKDDYNAFTNGVYDVSSTGLGVGLGSDNTVFASFVLKPDSNSTLWNIGYSVSNDNGKTWSAPAVVPGSEHLSFLNSNIYHQMTEPVLDKAGNWHIFGIGVDTTDYKGKLGPSGFPEPYRPYDFRFDGSTWTITKIAEPQLVTNGIVGWGDYADQEENMMNEPSIGPDGTIYYTYVDIIDTTGSNGDPDLFNFNIMVVYSEDNGITWSNPVSVLDQYHGYEPNGVARNATDKLHITYRDHHDADNPGLYYYMGVPTDTLKQLATSIGAGANASVPGEFALYQNYPNPFNPTTTIRFDLKESGRVRLTVYNALGQKIATLVDKKMQAGHKGVVWDAQDMPTGIYFYRLEAGSYTETKRMILLK